MRRAVYFLNQWHQIDIQSFLWLLLILLILGSIWSLRLSLHILPISSLLIKVSSFLWELQKIVVRKSSGSLGVSLTCFLSQDWGVTRSCRVASTDLRNCFLSFGIFVKVLFQSPLSFIIFAIVTVATSMRIIGLSFWRVQVLPFIVIFNGVIVSNLYLRIVLDVSIICLGWNIAVAKPKLWAAKILSLHRLPLRLKLISIKSLSKSYCLLIGGLKYPIIVVCCRYLVLIRIKYLVALNCGRNIVFIQHSSVVLLICSRPRTWLRRSSYRTTQSILTYIIPFIRLSCFVDFYKKN